MESALYCIYALRQHFPWSILYFLCTKNIVVVSKSEIQLSLVYPKPRVLSEKQGAWSSDHVYFLLNKSLVQHITSLSVYILFLETSGSYLVWVHTLFYSQLYTASKWLGNQSNYLGRRCGRVPCTARQNRYPTVPGSSPTLTTYWICSRSFQVQILLHAHK